MRKIFVTGIGTDVGKTVVSAVLTEALEADYWKPVQAGDLHNSDTMKVERWVSNDKSVFYPEGFALTQPMSPHAAAEIDKVSLKVKDLALPQTDNTLIIEGAGGIMVPVNYKETIADIIKKFDCETVLVIKNYLGSINHSLLSINCLKSHDINLLGIIYSGDSNSDSEKVIEEMTGVKCLGRIRQHKELNQEVIASYKNQFMGI